MLVISQKQRLVKFKMKLLLIMVMIIMINILLLKILISYHQKDLQQDISIANFVKKLILMIN